MSHRVKDVQRLTEALLKCDSTLDRYKRNSIVKQLPLNIQSGLKLGHSALEDILEIVNR